MAAILVGWYIWYTGIPAKYGLWAQETPIAIRISPQVGYAPLTVGITLRIEKHTDNRAAWLFWSDDGASWNSSAYQLDGERAPLIHYFQRTLRLPVEWYFYGVVVRTIGQHKTAVQKVKVVEGIPQGN